LNTNYRFNRNLLLALATAILLSPALRLFPSVSTDFAGRASWLSAPAALPEMLLYGWFISKFMDVRNEGEGLSELTLRALGDKAGKATLFLLSAWLLIYGGFVLRSGADRLITTIYPSSSPAIFTVILGTTALVAGLGSAQAIARSAKIMLPAVLGVLVIMLAFALFSINITNLLPVTGHDIVPILKASVTAIDVISLPLFSICFLYGMVPKAPGRFTAFSVWIAIIVILLTVLNVDVVGTFGSEMTSRLTRPFFSLVRNFVFFRSLERIEALVVTLWIFPDFLLVSLMIFSAQHSLRLVAGYDPEFRGEKIFDFSRGRWIIWLCAAVVILCGIFIAPEPVSLDHWSEKYVPLTNLVFALLVMPLIYIVGKLRKKF